MSVPWLKLGHDIDGELPGDKSGESVSLSADGTTVAIGARNNDGIGTDRGHVRVYKWINNTWSQVGNDIDGEADNDYSSWSVSLSADGIIVAIGARYNDRNVNESDRGHVRVYKLENNTWLKVGNDIDGEADNDLSGWSVSLSANGTTVAIGAICNDGSSGTESGHVRVYKWVNNAWTQLGNDIDGEATGDQSGYSVSLNDDGTILAIGAIYNDGNGSDSGHVRVYKWINNNWSQVGNDINGELPGDQSGWPVSLSADGTRVAIGATFNDGNGLNSGHVRVYTNSLQTLISGGVSLSQLIAQGVSLSQLLSGGATVSQLINEGASVSQLLSGGASVSQLIAQGVSVSQLLSGGATVSQLLSGGATVSQLIAEGVLLSQFKDNGVSASQLKPFYSVNDLKNAGYSLKDINISVITELKNTFSLSQLKKMGYSAYQFKSIRIKAKKLKEIGFTLLELKQAEFTLAELKLDFTLAELKQAGFTLAELKQADFTPFQLLQAGFTLLELSSVFTAQELSGLN